jgi:hypothetical protein
MDLLGRDVRQRQMAAWRHGGSQHADDLVGMLVVGDEVQRGQDQDGDGLAEIDHLAHVRVHEQLPWRAQIALDNRDALVFREQRLRMPDHHRVVIDINHPRGGSRLLSDLVDVSLRGQPGADVDDLADAARAHQEVDNPLEETPVVMARQLAIGEELHQFLRRVAIGLEVVLPAEQVVVDPGHVRHRYVKKLRIRIAEHTRRRCVPLRFLAAHGAYLSRVHAGEPSTN